MRKIFIKPYFWIGIYVFPIVLFAFIYSVNSSDFYHSNIAYERDYMELVEKVKDNFYLEIKNMIDLNNVEEAYYLEVPDTNYAISVEEIEVLRYGPTNIAFDVIVPLLDIAPITDFARLLIGIESILDVVILSLFINSLFHEITRMKIDEKCIE